MHRFQINRAYLTFVPSQTERSPPSPHPTRASRSSPAPARGRGQSWRYPAGSRSRFFSGISPCSGPRGYRHVGRGPGRGSPLPGQNGTRKFLSGNPHPARPSVSSPTRGAGAVRGDIRWEAVPGSSADVGFPEDREESASENRLETGSSPVPPRFLPGSSPVPPRAVDRGGYRPRGWGPGRGSPPSRRRVPVCSSSKPPPPRRGGQYVGIPGKSRLPGCKTPG